VANHPRRSSTFGDRRKQCRTDSAGRVVDHITALGGGELGKERRRSRPDESELGAGFALRPSQSF
jgi:hypothetical protein